MKKIINQERQELYIRNVIFGVEDSLVSTVGLLSGVAAAGVNRQTMIATGMILLLVEAFSMGMGSLLTEHSVEEYKEKKETPIFIPIIGGIVMFLSYFISGFIPLSPYAFFQPATAFFVSNILSLFSLIVLGVISAKLFKISVLRHALEMLLLGGCAIAVGIVAGRFLKI